MEESRRSVHRIFAGVIGWMAAPFAEIIEGKNRKTGLLLTINNGNILI